VDIFTGIDIVENKRIEEAVKKYKEKFLKRVFTDKELKYCLSKKESIPCLSARFACKEATIKAFYQAFGVILPLKSIEVVGKQDEPAEILLHLSQPLSKPYKIKASLSHEKNYSVACVLLILP